MKSEQLLHDLQPEADDAAFIRFLIEDTPVKPDSAQVWRMWQHIQAQTRTEQVVEVEQPEHLYPSTRQRYNPRRPRSAGLLSVAAVWLVLLAGMALLAAPRISPETPAGAAQSTSADVETARALVRLLLTAPQGVQLDTLAVAGALPELPVALPADPALNVIGGFLATNSGYQRASLFLTSALSVDEVIRIYQSGLQSPAWRDAGSELAPTLGSIIQNGERLLYCHESDGFFLHVVAAESAPDLTDIYVWLENNTVCGALATPDPAPSTDPTPRGTVTVAGEDAAALVRLAERIAYPIREPGAVINVVVGALPADLPLPLELHPALEIIGGISSEQRFAYNLELLAEIGDARLTFADIVNATDEVLLASPDWTRQDNHLYCYRSIGLVRFEEISGADQVRVFVGAGVGNPCPTVGATG